jgi:hypothetical protein
MTFTDDDMRAAIATTAPYTAVLLRHGPAYGGPDTPALVWEHGRRNFELRAAGKLAIVLPIRDDTDLAGIGIFALDDADTRAVMDGDPGVAAGIFTYETHPTRSFPGDALP